MINEIKNMKFMMSNKNVSRFVIGNLKKSLASIGYSKELIEDLIQQFKKYNFKEFQRKHNKELHKVHTIGFFQKIVPEYFRKYVVPFIPKVDKILDVGCGTGILAHILSKSGKFKQIIGIDINEYPEWKEFSDSKVKFQIVKRGDFKKFLRNNNPSAIVLTWTLHHMSYNEQENYLKDIYNTVDKIRIIILEDSYSTKLDPVEDVGVYETFMKFTKEDRQKIMSVNDWIANRVLERRDKIPMPFTYRTVEEWEQFFQNMGFKVLDKKFIGSIKKRDIYNPDSLIVIEK